MAGPALINLVLVLVLIFRQSAVARDLRPSLHGLPYQKQVGVVPPSTIFFFKNSSTIALPEGLEADGALGPPKGGGPSGSLPFFPARRRPEGDERRVNMLFVVAVVCAVAAVAFLGAALCLGAVFCRTRSGK